MQLFLIPTNKGLKSVRADNIIRIQAISNYCKIYFDNEYPLTVAKLLLWFVGKLPEDIFCRIHRGQIVNRNFISSISCNKILTLVNGEQLQISKRKKNVVKRMVA